MGPQAPSERSGQELPSTADTKAPHPAGTQPLDRLIAVLTQAVERSAPPA